MLFYVLITRTLKKEQKDRQKEKTLGDFVGKIATVKKDIGKTLSIDGLGFIEYNNEPSSAMCLDVEEKQLKRVTDEDARKIIKKYWEQFSDCSQSNAGKIDLL